MLNKQRCGKQPSASKAEKGPSKKGNPVSEYGDKANMEYKPVPKNPSWDGAGEQKKWS